MNACGINNIIPRSFIVAIDKAAALIGNGVIQRRHECFVIAH